VLDRLARAEAAGAAFTGMDIDGAGLVTMALKGQPVGPKTGDELAAIIRATRLPFLVKGVMTVEDAETAIRASRRHRGLQPRRPQSWNIPRARRGPCPRSRPCPGPDRILADGGVAHGRGRAQLLAWARTRCWSAGP
jgi:isopentenyl diphosphate isomerase/L-lactate dehydrogenase-like FMN-dependent dehydrogenase